MQENCQNIVNKEAPAHDGMHQNGRISLPLQPAFVPIDSRETAHDLVFIKKLAAEIVYYNSGNFKDGTWGAFFEKDYTVLLAHLSLLKAGQTKRDVFLLQQALKEQSLSTVQKKRIFDQLYQLVANLAMRFDQMKRQVPQGEPFTNFLENLILNLKPYYEKAIAYHKGATARNLLTPNQNSDLKVFEKLLEPALGIFQSYPFVTAFGNTPYAAIPADSSIFGNGALHQQIFLGSTHYFFTEILNRFVQGYSRMILEGLKAFSKELTHSGHLPHTTLLLVFSGVMKKQRGFLNGLSEKHLNFYYRDVLQLAEKAPQASYVHLLAELTKQTPAYALPANTLLKAGKDAARNEIFFETVQEVLLNQAQITDLKTLYRATETDQTQAAVSLTQPLTGRLYASDFTGTADESKAPFADKQFIDGKLAAIETSVATLGFAVASNYLFMREGTRTITLTITLDSAPTLTLLTELKKHFEGQISIEKGWELLTLNSATLSGSELELIFEMDEEQDATSPYNAKVHGGQFITSRPILKVKLLHLPDDYYLQGQLFNATISEVNVHIEVDNVRQLFLSNDFGKIDTSKPFNPFGISPKKNNGLVIGNSEIFQKNSEVEFIWDWKETEDTTLDGEQDDLAINATKLTNNKFKFRHFTDGAWSNAALNNTFFTVSDDDLMEEQYNRNPDFNAESTSGFVKIQYNGDFETNFNEYLQGLATALGATTPTIPPSPPGSPTAIGLLANYSANVSSNLTEAGDYAARKVEFFHLYPFGELERHAANDEPAIAFLPDFRHNNFGDPFFLLKNKEVSALNDVSGLDPEDIFSGQAEHEAEFYIGLEKLQPPGSVSVLFQVEDGTADPRIRKPEHHIHWSYLTAKGWKSFAKREITDDTTQWLNSGIITFNIPADASNTYPLMPNGKIWLRAAVAGSSATVCKLKAVLPNATKAVMLDPKLHPDLLQTQLKAGTISKLKTPVNEVKKLLQPFDSFGGRPVEESEAFYTCISERLRHKDRAVSAYDYERLILEEFPGIHRVKCLNHTRYEVTETNQLIYNELAAGHVSIITLPDLRFNKQVNPLEPYTSLSVLEAIDRFISDRKPPFAQLHVCNPIFEKVRMSFDLVLLQGYDETFYTAKLQEAITAFLSPWAFEPSADLLFGGTVEKSVLINFIEEQPYVDYLEKVKLYHSAPDAGGIITETEVDTAIASTQASILVSAPAPEHLIHVLTIELIGRESPSCGC